MPDRPSPARFWDELGERSRELLAAAGRERRVAPRRHLFDEGERASTVAVLLDGRVKITTTTLAGHERLLAVRGPSDLVGEMATFTDVRRTAAVTAIDALRALVVPAATFAALWDREPEVLRAFVRMLVARVQEADQARMDLLDDAPVRVRRTLVTLANRFGSPSGDGGCRIELGLTQDELAHLAFTTRGVVTTVLRDLRAVGLVRTGRRSLELVDVAAIDPAAATAC
jgi:CRP-like cAMP-binding protein